MNLQEEQNLCLKCPVRGKCCYHSILIEGFNVILDNFPCFYLNTNTNECRIYDKRNRFKSCSPINLNEGSVPKECLYLNGKKERFPKVWFHEIEDQLTINGKRLFHSINDNKIIKQNYISKIKREQGIE